jgi:hypothetical protein
MSSRSRAPHDRHTGSEVYVCRRTTALGAVSKALERRCVLAFAMGFTPATELERIPPRPTRRYSARWPVFT